MNIYKYIVLFFIISVLRIPSTGSCNDNSVPSDNTIIEWWSNVPENHEELASVDATSAKKIFLCNREAAFLFKAGLFPAGRNNWDTVIMVRPAKKQAREISLPPSREHIEIQSFKNIMYVYDLNHDGVSEIELGSYESGQGIFEYSYSIVQFDNWNPIILHRIEFSENSGCCGIEEGNCGECHYQDVSWKFVDFDRDGVDDLIEEIITQQGSTRDKLTKTKTNAYYLFKNKKFIKADDTSKLNLP